MTEKYTKKPTKKDLDHILMTSLMESNQDLRKRLDRALTDNRSLRAKVENLNNKLLHKGIPVETVVERVVEYRCNCNMPWCSECNPRFGPA